jgi:hypothetical protein
LSTGHQKPKSNNGAQIARQFRRAARADARDPQAAVSPPAGNAGSSPADFRLSPDRRQRYFPPTQENLKDRLLRGWNIVRSPGTAAVRGGSGL